MGRIILPSEAALAVGRKSGRYHLAVHDVRLAFKLRLIVHPRSDFTVAKRRFRVLVSAAEARLAVFRPSGPIYVRWDVAAKAMSAATYFSEDLLDSTKLILIGA